MSNLRISNNPDSSRGSRSAAAQPEVQPRADHDLITNPRDEHDNREGGTYPCTTPTVDGVPFEETPLATALQALTEKHPLFAAWIAHFYNRRLLATRRRVEQVRAEQDADLRQNNQLAIETNKDIDGQIERLVKRRDSETKRHFDELEALDPVSQAAHERAAEAIAPTGIVYLPGVTSEADILRIPARTSEAMHAKLKLPAVQYDHKIKMHPAVSVFVTLALGVLMGVSFGLIAGSLHSDTLDKTRPALAVWAIIGIAVAFCCKYAMRMTSGRGSERYYLGHRVSNWAPFVGLSVIAFAGYVYLDANVEKMGLLRFATAHARLGTLGGKSGEVASSEITGYWCVAMLAMLAVMTVAYWEGYLECRKHVVLNRVEDELFLDKQQAEQERRSDSVVQRALAALSQVNVLLWRKQVIADRIAHIAQPFDQEIARLQSRHLPENQLLSDEARKRHQDTLDRFRWAQSVFDMMFYKALEMLNPDQRTITNDLTSLHVDSVSSVRRTRSRSRSKWHLRLPSMRRK